MTREKELKEHKYREQKKIIVIGVRALYKCPTCDKGLNEFDRFDYCPYCGQKLDWSVLDD